MVTPSEQQNWPISARPMRGSWNRREKKMLFIGQSKWTKKVFCRVVFLELLKRFQTLE